MSYKIEFIYKQINPWGGVVLMKRFLDKPKNRTIPEIRIRFTPTELKSRLLTCSIDNKILGKCLVCGFII